MKNTAFSPQAIIMILICAVLLFSLSVLLPAFDERPLSTGSLFGPGSFSSSAIGHAGFYDVLRRLERPVERAVGDAPAAVGHDGTLIALEPEQELLDDNEYLLLDAPRLLLVLPKWQGFEHKTQARWIGRARLVPVTEAQGLLDIVAEKSFVIRQHWPLDFTVNELPFTPTGTGRAQLIRSEKMRPLVGTADGFLLGEIMHGGRRIWVLSDPDIMSNHGLGNGQNAAFMVALMDALRTTEGGSPQGPIVFEESLHGFRPPEWSPAKLLFRLPFAAVTTVVLASAVIMLLAGCGRFGAARPAKRPLDFGKAGLIANGARLLEHAGHQGVTLKSYIRMTVYSAALALHAPGRLKDRDLMEWLDRLGRARGVKISCAEIINEMSEIPDNGAGNARLFKCARRIYIWKGEILNGSGTGRINRQ